MRAYHLISKEQDSFETELAIAQVKQVFQARTEQIHHHDIVITLHTKPFYAARNGLHD
jgi:hypothetical protein